MDSTTKTTTTIKVDQQQNPEVVQEEQAADNKQPILDSTSIAENKDSGTKIASTEEKAAEPTAAATTTSSTTTSTSTTKDSSPPEVVTSSENEQEESSNESDQESSTSSTTTTTTNSDDSTTTEPQDQEEDTNNEDSSSSQEQAQQDEPLSDVRRLIAGGLGELTRQERNQIEEEVHGVAHLGSSPEPHVQVLFLKKFQEVLDMVLSGSMSLPKTSTAAYELCLQKNYMYATNESEELRLMCLRAELWDPSRACERFLHHLTALLKYYGEDGLSKPMTIDQLDREENNNNNNKASSDTTKGGRKQSKKRKQSEQARGIYKKGRGGSKRKGSLDSLPDMLALKSGFLQVLPSRDRSGRRVVVLQPVPSTATSQQTQQQVQHSKFKALIYFFTAFLRRDLEAQQKGFVLILNSTKTEEIHREADYGSELLQQYEEVARFIPVRICALHFAFDKDSLESIPHKISRRILESYIENNPKMNYARVHLYDQDVSNDSTKHKISPFGIPTHQIPLTHTGTIKLKEHNGWVKIQEWYDKKSKQQQHQLHQHSKFNVIECPCTNDVLFSQGGKYWNGVNRFQRGNLEFMEFLESKIDLYQSTLSWKKKHTILAAVVAEFAQTPQSTGNHARFLETATQIEGVMAPDGCWVELPLTSPLLMQKIRQTLLNHIRRLESSGKRKPAPSKATRAKKGKNNKNNNKQSSEETTSQPSKAQTIVSGQAAQPEKTKKNTKITNEDNLGPNKKRKMELEPFPVMKNNKLAIATFGNSIHNSIHNSTAINNETSLLHKQAMCEFLANAERIAVSTAAVDIACENYETEGIESNLDEAGNNLQDAIANDEKLVQAIIANDDRLNKEVGELFEMDSFLKDEEDLGDVERDEIADCLMGCML